MKHKYEKNDLKIALIGISAFLIYMFLPKLQSLPFALLNINTDTIPLAVKVIYSLGFELILAIIIISLFIPKLKKDFTDLKKHHQDYFNKYLKYWLLALAIMMISNLLIGLINPDQLPANEKNIREIFNISPIYMFLSAVVFAPVVEELVFRLGFRYMFKTNWLFIALSGLIFGGLHVFSTAESLSELLYLIPYCTPGFIFAYILTKTDNIFVPMGLHFMHNGLLMSLQFIVLIFG